jgi:hypothetical protein
MATTTTKLGLTKPDFVDVVDISQLNTNANKIDAAAGFTICTSSTRPSTPWLGQPIFETDTVSSKIWNGTAWIGTTGFTICTSSTRPSVPWLGQPIFETDTLKSFVWDGSAWKVLGGGAGGGFDSVFLLMGA